MFQDSLSPSYIYKWHLENYRAFDYNSYIEILRVTNFLHYIISHYKTLGSALAKHSLCLDAFLDVAKTTVG